MSLRAKIYTEVHAHKNEKAVRLADKAYSIIEKMIVTLELPPGSVFSEVDLSRQINIGRTPLREALQRLTADRLIATLPRRGVVVTEINITEQLALLETRRVLDRLLAAKAAIRATIQQRKALQETAFAIENAAAKNNIPDFMHLDSECDTIIAIASRNPFAARATAPLHSHCRRLWYLQKEKSDLMRSASLHAHLMNRITKQDEKAASDASDKLIDYVEEFTRAALDLF